MKTKEEGMLVELILEAIDDVQRMEKEPLVVETHGFLFDLNDTKDLDLAADVLNDCVELDMNQFLDVSEDFEVTDETGEVVQ